MPSEVRCPACNTSVPFEFDVKSVSCQKCAETFPVDIHSTLADRWKALSRIRKLTYVVLVLVPILLIINIEAPNWGIVGPPEQIDTRVPLRNYSSRIESALERGDEAEACRLIDEANGVIDTGSFLPLSERAIEVYRAHQLRNDLRKAK